MPPHWKMDAWSMHPASVAAPRGAGEAWVRACMRGAFDEAQRARRPFGVAVVQAELGVLARLGGEALAAERWSAFLDRVAGELAPRGAWGYEAAPGLVLGLPLERARGEGELGERLLALGEPVPLAVAAGLASSSSAEFPFEPGLLFDTLLAVAEEGLRVALEAGGRRWVHTELYGLFQRALARRDPDRVALQRDRVLGDAPIERELELVPRPRPRALVEGAAVEAVLPSPVSGKADAAAGQEPETSDVPGRPDGDAELEPLARSPVCSLHELERTIRLAAQTDDPLLARLFADLALQLGSGVAGLGWPGERRVLLELALRAERAQRSDGPARRIDLLERRLAKLGRALASVEAEVSDARRSAAREEGIASIHRNVQGLSPEDSAYERRRELMDRLFRANLDLRRQVAGAGITESERTARGGG